MSIHRFTYVPQKTLAIAFIPIHQAYDTRYTRVAHTQEPAPLHILDKKGGGGGGVKT